MLVEEVHKMEYDNFKDIKEKIEELESRINSLENPEEGEEE
jgi:hypothetical protein